MRSGPLQSIVLALEPCCGCYGWMLAYASVAVRIGWHLGAATSAIMLCRYDEEDWVMSEHITNVLVGELSRGLPPPEG